MKRIFASALFWFFLHAGLAAAPQKQVNGSGPCLSVDVFRSSLQSGASDTKRQTGAGTGAAFWENQQGITAIIGLPADLKKAEHWIEKAARRGYAPAEVNLAMMYIQGWGVARNDGAALYWLTLAAQQGQPLA